jgi:hypothetical protein
MVEHSLCTTTNALWSIAVPQLHGEGSSFRVAKVLW